MNTIRNALAMPGAISGRVMVVKICIGDARNVRAASSSDALMPSATPTSTKKATGVSASVCASHTPGRP